MRTEATATTTVNIEQVAELWKKGWSTREIAEKLDVSQRTIQRWLKRIQPETETTTAPQNLTPIQEHKKPTLTLINPTGGEFRELSDLTAEGVREAITELREIIKDRETRPSDRIAAAALLGKWLGLEGKGNRVVRSSRKGDEFWNL